MFSLHNVSFITISFKSTSVISLSPFTRCVLCQRTDWSEIDILNWLGLGHVSMTILLVWILLTNQIKCYETVAEHAVCVRFTQLEQVNCHLVVVFYECCECEMKNSSSSSNNNIKPTTRKQDICCWRCVCLLAVNCTRYYTVRDVQCSRTGVSVYKRRQQNAAHVYIFIHAIDTPCSISRRITSTCVHRRTLYAKIIRSKIRMEKQCTLYVSRCDSLRRKCCACTSMCCSHGFGFVSI